jgi:hypothetical protein
MHLSLHPLRRFVCALTVCALAACGSSSDNVSDGAGGSGGSSGSSSGDKIADKGDIVPSWEKTSDRDLQPLVEAIRDTKLVEEIAGALNDSLRFPRDLGLTHLDCGEENAFYVAKEHGVFMCYELLKSITVAVYDTSASDEENTQALIGTWLFVMFHELGHALIDQYDLPVTGKEEDAVDDFSTIVLIESGLSDMALNAAAYWAKQDPAMYDSLSYADEHSLNSQRFFGILCTVYGSDPQAYGDLVKQGVLPETRAARCPSEYEQKLKSWSKLLEPYAK